MYFAVATSRAVDIDIMQFSSESSRKLFVDWSIFSMAFYLSRGHFFDESAGIALCMK